MSTAMTSRVGVGKLRGMWVKKFDEQKQLHKQNPPHDHWEGSFAYRELEDTRNLWRVLPTVQYGDGPLNVLMNNLSREVHIYKLYETAVVPDNQCFRDGLDALSAAKTKLTKTRTQESKVKPRVDTALNQCTLAIEKARNSLEKSRASYWEEVLLAPTEERMKWSVYVDKKTKQVNTIPPEDITEAEKIFENAKYPRNLVRQRDLDKRFQLRVATILRLHLPSNLGVSLKTISRLTVLTYICGELRAEGPNGLFLLSKPSAKGGEITVRGVDGKLRNAGMK